MARTFKSSRAFPALALAATLVWPVPAPGQEPSGGIIGRTVDLASRAPIGGARIALLGTPRRTGTDSAGRFTQAGLPAGTYVLQIRAIGYDVAVWVVQLAEGEVLDHVFELAPLGHTLDPVVVEGRPSFTERRMREFHERRAEGRGIFVTEDQIKTTKAATLGDLLRGVPGVRVACRPGGCVVEMTRSARGVCRADWVVDGFPATQSATPHIPTVGVVGIEVYRSPGETPQQFLKSDSQCGVIVVWTKSGP